MDAKSDVNRRGAVETLVSATAAGLVTASLAQTGAAAAPTFQSKRGLLQTPMGAMHYVEAGTGAPLLMLHATHSSHWAFGQLQPMLAEKYRTFGIDTFGFGYSDPLPPNTSIEMLGDNLIAFLDAHQISKANFYGVNTDNKIASAFAARHPDRV